MKKQKVIIFALIIIFIVAILVGRNWWRHRESRRFTGPPTGNTPTASPATNMANPASVYCQQQGGQLVIQTDEQGGQAGICQFSDGSACEEWAYFRHECSPAGQLTPTSSQLTDEQAILAALVAKDGLNPDLYQLTVKTNDGQYASGGLQPKEALVGGAYWFAAKTSQGWQIVASGNGQINCDNLKPYPDYPTTLIPECISSQGQLVKR